MTVEIQVFMGDRQVAEGTYGYCAAALGYSPKTLAQYASSPGAGTLEVKRLPPLYRLHGEGNAMPEVEACERLGISRRKLQVKSSDPHGRVVHRYMRQPWALPSEEIEKLWKKGSCANKENRQ